jgi:thiol-disulfide isomerase/thioredoxin
LPLADGNNSQISLEQLRGQPLVVEVFAEWCSACKAMAPRLGELARANRKSPVRFLGIAVDGSEPELRALKRQWNIPYDVALGDARFSSDYAISVLPTVIVIDADGKVQHVTTGVTSSSRIDGWLSDLGAPRQ